MDCGKFSGLLLMFKQIIINFLTSKVFKTDCFTYLRKQRKHVYSVVMRWKYIKLKLSLKETYSNMIDQSIGENMRQVTETEQVYHRTRGQPCTFCVPVPSRPRPRSRTLCVEPIRPQINVYLFHFP